MLFMRRLTLTFSIVAIAGIALGVAAQPKTAIQSPAKVVVYKSPS
jgi:hypothetical protein